MACYSLLLGLGLAVNSPWWVLLLLTRRKNREGLRERLGQIPRRLREAVTGREVVWLHAVSVGEVLAASQLVRELETALEAQATVRPWRVVVSTTTRTGQVLARARFGPERVFWFPLDFAWTVRAWLGALRPRLVILVESELWPRLLAECARREIPVAVVNARLSDRSFRRARRVRKLWARVLGRVSVFLPQSEETARRLSALGVASGAIRVTGNLKYDVQPRETEMVAMLRPLLEQRSLVVAGSLLGPEEKMLLKAWPAVRSADPEAVLLLAPRHPERFPEVARSIKSAVGGGDGMFFRASDLLARQHGGERLPEVQAGAVLLLDTVGDLAAAYALGDVAFVGGSLVSRGGHNPLEPARFGVPVVMGSSFENFREIVEEMQAVDGIEIVHGGPELAAGLIRLLKDRVEADALGQRGRKVFARRSGATRRSVDALLPLLVRTQPRPAGEVST